jgi:hypothetical protein
VKQISVREALRQALDEELARDGSTFIIGEEVAKYQGAYKITGDLYLKYIDLFDLKGQEHTIRRAIVFLEDWQPGHYAEYQDVAFVNWRAGATIEWTYDTPHMAANLGLTPRYTLQITGHVDD